MLLLSCLFWYLLGLLWTVIVSHSLLFFVSGFCWIRYLRTVLWFSHQCFSSPHHPVASSFGESHSGQNLLKRCFTSSFCSWILQANCCLSVISQTWIHVLVLLLSVVSYFGFVLLFSLFCVTCSPPTIPLGVETLQMSEPIFYIICTLTTVTALIPRYVLCYNYFITVLGQNQKLKTWVMR